eukprot:10109349-Alexandrium_andersonii.AAC.1
MSASLVGSEMCIRDRVSCFNSPTSPALVVGYPRAACVPVTGAPSLPLRVYSIGDLAKAMRLVGLPAVDEGVSNTIDLGIWQHIRARS